MEITTDTIKTKDELYNEFDLSQLIILMDIGEKLTISIDDVVVKEYTAKYVNCHFNLVFQDKGIEIDLEQLTEEEILQKQIDVLEEEKSKIKIK